MWYHQDAGNFPAFFYVKETGMTVTGVGQCCWDYLALVDGYPAADSKAEVHDWTEQGGGPVATALVALTRLGIRTRFAGVVGDDPLGEQIHASLVTEGVETAGLVTRIGALSQRAFIVIEPGEGSRTIFWQRPTGMPLQPVEIPADFLAGSDFLLLDGLMPEVSLALADEARARGIGVMLDAGRMRPGMMELAQRSDYVVAGEQFALDLGWDGTVTGFTELAIRLRYPFFTVTRGARGSLTLGSGELLDIPAFPVDVVDTTGTGDVFHGGYLFGLLQGWQLRKTITFASALAALACTRIGGRTGIPSLPEVLAFLADRGCD